MLSRIRFPLIAGVPAANREMPPPSEVFQVLFTIALLYISAEALPPTLMPPPPIPPEYPGVWPLFETVLSRMRGDPKEIPMPPPPLVAELLLIRFPMIVGDEYQMRIPPPSLLERPFR